MSRTEQLVALIHQIRQATSPLGRVKMVALAWRSLRGMSLPDRIAVAKEIGLEGAEKLVERMADRGGISPSVVLSAIRRAESSGATTPADLLRELLGGAAEELAKPEAEVERAAEPAFETSFEPISAEVESSLTAAEKAAALKSADAETLSDPFPAVPEQVQAAPPVEIAGRTSLAEEPPKAPPPAEMPEEPAPAIELSPSVQPVPAPAAGDSALLEDLKQQSFLLKRLRVLDRRIEETRQLGRDRLLQLLELFPAGWSRRRALEKLIRTGVPAQLDDLLALVEQLQRPSERLWTLTTVAATRGLTPGEKEMLVKATRQRSLQRRLRIRLGVGLTQ